MSGIDCRRERAVPELGRVRAGDAPASGSAAR